MAKKSGKQEARKPAPVERLGMRVSAMINSPRAQLERRVTIHRLDDDPDEAWDSVMELLAETDGLQMIFNDDGTVTLMWDKASDEEAYVREGEMTPVDAEPAPF